MSVNLGIEAIVGNLGGSVLSQIKQIAPIDTTILITGETGTGKTLVAKIIHQQSSRNHGNFVPVNCAALPETLMESELFGYARGAFTGATHDKPGRFNAADDGTIFLDEIGDVPLHIQVKLLRVIEEKMYERIGDNQSHTTNARIIAATNQNLIEAIKNKTFREDLYYRLQKFEIEIPPLRHRRDDIKPLIYHFIAKSLRDIKKDVSIDCNFGNCPTITVDGTVLEIEDRFIDALLNYSFPGNVRELSNYVERAAIMVDGGYTIRFDYLPERVRKQPNQKRLVEESLDATVSMLGEMHRLNMGAADYMRYLRIRLVCQALEINDGNHTRAARELGLNKATVYNTINIGLKFLEKHHLPVPDYIMKFK